MVILAACGRNDESTNDRPEINNAGAIVGSIDPTLPVHNIFEEVEMLRERFPSSVLNHAGGVAGGTLTIGMPLALDVSMNAIASIFLQPYQDFDGNLLPIDLIMPDLLARDEYGWLIVGDHHNGPIILNVFEEHDQITLTMRDGVEIFWHDGVMLTLSDLVFAYEVVIDTLHNNQEIDISGRFLYNNIVGVWDYLTMVSDHISGLVLSNDHRELTISFTEMDPALLYTSFGLLGVPMPRHHFTYWGEDHLGYGPFILETVDHQNRTITMVANTHYWQGIPNLDSVVFKFFDMNDSMQFLSNDDIDVMFMPIQLVPEAMDVHNITLLGEFNDMERYIYFYLGRFAGATPRGFTEVEPRNDGHPITDPRFRQALAYAWNQVAIDETFNIDMFTPAMSFLNPRRDIRFINPEGRSLSTFDLDAANQMLDAAGYVWGDDGFRRDLHGNPFVVNIAMLTGGNSEFAFEIHRNNFAAIGVDLRLFEERFFVLNQIRDEVMLPTANSDMHMFEWFSRGMSASEPSIMWRMDSMMNPGGFYDAYLTELLARLNTDAAWNMDYMQDVMRQIDLLLYENVPAIPLSWWYNATAVNNRISHWTTERSAYIPSALNWHQITVSHTAAS